MATKEKWAKVFHTFHQYKDDIPIYFGDAKDAHIAWDNSNATLDITGATQFTGAMGIEGNVTLIGDVTTTGETSAMTVEDPTTATNAYYGYIDAGGATGWTGSMAAVRGRVNITNTGTSIGNAYGGWFGVQFDSTFTATGAGLTCGVYAEIDNELAGRAPNAVAYFQECVTGSGVNTGMPILVLTSDGGGSNEDKSGIAIEFGHVPAGKTVSTGSSGIFNTSTIRVKVNGTVFYLPLSSATNTFTYAGQQVGTCTTTGVAQYTHVYNTLTISTSHSGQSVAGLRVYAQTADGTAGMTLGNLYGIRSEVKLLDTDDTVTGNTSAVYAAVDLGTVVTTGEAYCLYARFNATGTRGNAPEAWLGMEDGSPSTQPVRYLMDVGGSTLSCPTGAGNVYYTTTLKFRVNGTDRWLPLSTVENAYTTAAVITTSNTATSTSTTTGAVIIGGGLGVAERANFGDKVIATCTAPTAAINAIAGLATPGATWASGEVNGVYGKTTITLDSDGSTYSAAGGHFELEMVGNATSGLGLLASCMVKFTSNLEEPNAILYLESYPTGSCDLSETPFITFCDYKAGSGVKSNTLFRIGDPMMGQAISTGDGKLSYNQTLRCALYDTPIYLVTSTAQGTYTTAYPVVLSYTSGAALAITQATVGNDARIATFHGTCATPAMGDGVGNVEVDTTLTGQATGHLSPFSSWVNVTTGTVTAAVTSYVTPMTVGIYEGGSGTVTSGLLAFGMRMQAILTNSPGILAPFSVNTNKTITAIFHVNSQPNFGYVAGLHTSAVTGSVPLMCALGGGSVKYVRVYDTAA